MTKFNCVACTLDRQGVKTNAKPVHTCAKADPKYQEPETITFKDESGLLPSGVYYKIKIHKRIHETGKATKYSIIRNQFLNGYKVPSGTATWFQDALHYMDTNLPLQPCIWVHESKYKELAFI